TIVVEGTLPRLWDLVANCWVPNSTLPNVCETEFTSCRLSLVTLASPRLSTVPGGLDGLFPWTSSGPMPLLVTRRWAGGFCHAPVVTSGPSSLPLAVLRNVWIA